VTDDFGTQPRPARRRSVAWLAAFVGLHVAFILAAPTELYHLEEYVNLRLAADVLGEEGQWIGAVPKLPPSVPESTLPRPEGLGVYQYQSFDGGTLVSSMLLVPIAAVLGLGAAAVKCGALLWALATVLGWIAVLGRLYGRVGRGWAALAFLGVPVPLLIMWSVHWGNHAESAAFVPAVLWLLLRARDDQGRRAVGWCVAAGLLGGLGAWFSLLNLLPLALIVVGLPLLAGWRGIPAVGVFAAGALAGALPLRLRNIGNTASDVGAQGVDFAQVLAGLRSANPRQLLRSLNTRPQLAHWDFPGLWTPGSGLEAGLEIVLRGAGVAGAALVLLGAIRSWRRGSWPAARARLFVLGIVVLSGLGLPLILEGVGEVHDRRLAPSYVLLWVVVAMGLASAQELGRLARPALILGLALIVAQLGLSLRVIGSWNRPPEPLEAWTLFAVPAAFPAHRTQGGIPQLDVQHVAPLNRAARILMEGTETGGVDEIRGLARGFAPDVVAHGSGVLGRAATGCPGGDYGSISNSQVIARRGEARAWGWALGIRCVATPEDVQPLCGGLQGDGLVAACRQGLASSRGGGVRD
jgi:hypothetical protein